MNDGRDVAEREAVAERLLSAPPDRVFRALSNAEHLERWWGPEGFRTTTHSFDFRPGGMWRCTLHGPDGVDYENEYVFAEIDPHRVVIDHPDPAHWFRLTISLKEQDGRTRIVWQQVFDTRALPGGERLRHARE